MRATTRYLLIIAVLVATTAIARDHKGPPSPFMQCRNQGGTDASCKHLLPANPGVEAIKKDSEDWARKSKTMGSQPKR